MNSLFSAHFKLPCVSILMLMCFLHEYFRWLSKQTYYSSSPRLGDPWKPWRQMPPSDHKALCPQMLSKISDLKFSDSWNLGRHVLPSLYFRSLIILSMISWQTPSKITPVLSCFGKMLMRRDWIQTCQQKKNTWKCKTAAWTSETAFLNHNCSLTVNHQKMCLILRAWVLFKSSLTLKST